MSKKRELCENKLSVGKESILTVWNGVGSIRKGLTTNMRLFLFIFANSKQLTYCFEKLGLN